MANDILVKVGADISDFSRKMAESNRALNEFGRANQETFNSFKKVGAMSVAAGTAIGVGLGKSVKVAADFESAMSNVKAISGATGEQFNDLRDKAIEMGNKTKFSASESADAMANLAQMGWKTDDILAGVEHTLNLAAAGGLELADAAMISANTMNQFGLEASEAERVADVFAYTAANAGTDVTEMGDAMKYAGANASAAGMSIEDTAAFIGVLGDAGISGSKAGTTLNAMLRDLKKNSEDGAIAVGEQSVALYDAEGNMRNMPDVIGDIIRATETMSDEQRDAALSTIMGDQALIGFNAIAEKGADSVAILAEELYGSEGAAADMAAVMEDNLNGAITELSSAFEGVQIAIGSALIPVIRELTEWLKSLADWFNALPESTQKNIAFFLAFSSVALIVGGALLLLIGFVPQIIGGFTALSNVTKALGTVMGGLSLPMIALIAVIGLVVAAVVYLWKTNEDFRNNITIIWNAIRDLITAVWEAIRPGAEAFIGVLVWLIQVMAEVIGWVVGVVAVMAEWISAFIEANQWIIQVIQVLAVIIGVIAGVVAVVTVIVKAFTLLVGIVKLVAAVFVFLMSPIGLVVGAIALVIAIVVALGNKFEWLGNIVSAVTDWMSEKWNSFLGFFGLGTKEAADEASDAIEGVSEKGQEDLDALAEGGKQSTEDLKEGVTANMDEMSMESLDSLDGLNIEGIASMDDLSAEGIGSATDMNAGVTSEIGDMSNLSIDDLKNMEIEGLSATGGLESGVTSDVSKMSADVKSQVGDMESSASGDFSGLTSDMSANASKVQASVTQSFAGMSQSINSEMSNMRSIAKGGMRGIATDIAAGMTLSTKAIQASMQAMSQEFTRSFTLINKTVQASFTALNNYARNGMNRFNSTISRSNTLTINGFRTSFRAVNQAVSSGMTGAIASVRAGNNAIVASTRSLRGQLYSAGVHAMGGLRSGLNAGRGGVMSTARNIANSVARTMRAALKVKSPSRVMMDIGKWTSVGLAEGMQDYASKVDKASNILAEAAQPDVSNIDMSYATPDGISARSLAGAVSGTVDVNSRDDRLINAIGTLERRLTNLEVVMDGREVGRIVEPHVTERQEYNSGRLGRFRGRG